MACPDMLSKFQAAFRPQKFRPISGERVLPSDDDVRFIAIGKFLLFLLVGFMVT
jgi:hypothetical protein